MRNAPIARRYSFLALGLVLVSVLTFVTLSRSSSTGEAAPAPMSNTGEVLVKFKTRASERAIEALNASMATQQVDAIPALGVRVLRIPDSRGTGAVAQAYARNPLVQFAEVNSLVAPETIPNDPKYSNAWHLPKIQAPNAWDRARATGVLIAICDTGVAAVPDLMPVLRSDLGWNAVDGTTNWTDSHGHGTQVAGAAAAATDNGLGVTGVAWGAQIIPVRISNLSSGSAYVSDAAKCINYAADHGARVINVSFLMAGSATIDSAGRYAQDRGAVTTVAAGNDGVNPGWPNYPGFLAVSATDQLDRVTTWSDFGSFVDISAPGNNIMTTRYDGTYWTATGTSVASPVGAGVLALIFGANPSLSAEQAQSILLASADDLGDVGSDPYFGGGRVNAQTAVSAALAAGPSSSPTPNPTSTAGPSATSTPTPGSTATPSLTPTRTPTFTPVASDTVPPAVTLNSPGQSQSVRGSASMSATASDNVAVARVEFYIDGVLYKTVTSAPFSTGWNTRRWNNGSHVITSKAYDAAANSASDSHTVTVSN